ncbi:endolytic transglycosylase MltG [Acutalibacter intestini]|uniref:endolytic transglycosylase MltG n=1 Tax=Acutalibacter intestini TaxID=3093659 RepID=UPI002AC9AFBC|nr:endolytic transglycosylase MltG [Acutalibacter sp. M00204]
MNERPQHTEPKQNTGGFKVNIDQRDLMGSADLMNNAMPRQRHGQPAQYSEPVSAKRAVLTEKERKAEKKAHKRRNRVKARKNKRVFSLVWLCMVLLISFTLASYLIGGANDVFAVGRIEGKVDIQIPEGELTEEQLADILYKAGAINKPDFFTLYCKVTSDMEFIKPGLYRQIGTNLDYEYLLNSLVGGDDDLEIAEAVTFPEGVTALQAAQILEENEVCSAQDFLNALNNLDFSNYDMIKDLNGEGKYYKLEGYLFPDTYDFYKGEELDSVIGKMLNNFKNKVEKLMDRVSESGMTLDQVVTLASIIQAEAASTADMFDVSAVLHNRLEHGEDYDIFFLECDSTMYYPYKNAQEKDEKGGTLSYGNYDTYQVRGLPAGAICNPGVEALNAALKPSSEASEYLYFCHSAEGEPYYASTPEEHEYNKQLAGLE